MQTELVKCSNRNCGLILPLGSWRLVATDNPRVTAQHCPRCDNNSFYSVKPGEVEKPKTGAQLIALERGRQLKIEGWTPEHDDKHKQGEMAFAASSYAQLAGQISIHGPKVIDKELPPGAWPWTLNWWKPSENNIKNLVRAGALIAAEIDRLKRLENK